MKWIDDQDDYYLHDYDSEKGNSDGRTDGNGAAGQTGETSPDGSTDENSHTTQTPKEFSFSDSNENSSRTDSSTASEAALAADKDKKARRRRRHRRFAWFFIILFAVAAIAFYIRYYIPYTSDTLTTGYINMVEKRGIFFKTFEGEMISESCLNDTSKVYSRDFYFSIPNDSLGRVAQSYQNTGKRVIVTTQKYFGTLPWRGSQKIVLTDIRPAQ